MNNRTFLKSFFTEHWKYMTVNAACKLNLFDALDITEKTIKQVSKLLSIPDKNIELLLNALVNIKFLEQTNLGYKLNNLSILLTEKHPKTLKHACLNWSGDHLEAWDNLNISIKTGKSAFENKYGINYFDYINKNEKKLDQYHKAMFAYAKDDYQNITDVINLNKSKSVMDVGGSYGAAISQIKKIHPNLKCYLFDLESVINKCTINSNIQLIKGDFFSNIPKLSETIILSRILHDWNDKKGNKILNNVYQALPENGYLYIIENCSDKIDIDLSLLSLNMLTMCQSFERSSYQYIALANQSKFKFEEAKKLNDLQTILIFRK
jgi:hypothetical protein